MTDPALANRVWHLTDVHPTTYDQDGHTADLGHYQFTSEPATAGSIITVNVPRAGFWRAEPPVYDGGTPDHGALYLQWHRYHRQQDTLAAALVAWGDRPKPPPEPEPYDSDDYCDCCGRPWDSDDE